jgi:hypothetical protein
VAVVLFQSTLSAGPQGCGDCGSSSSYTAFPSLLGGTCGKSAGAFFGTSFTLSSPAAPLALSLGNVARGNTLWLKGDSSMELTLDLDDGAGGTTTFTAIPFSGNFGPLEFPDARFIKGVAVQGAGRLEYFISGPS